MALPKNVLIREVGPRDGLQNESVWLDTMEKRTWIHLLEEAHLPYIEVTSFVHPKWVPALKDAKELAQSLNKKEDITYAALIPNEKGLAHFFEANLEVGAMFISSSETHNKKNMNRSIQETLPVIKQMTADLKAEGRQTRAYISTVFGCPYEKQVPMDQVLRLTEQLLSFGIDEISLGDTIGEAHPLQVERRLDLLLERFPADKIALHFHDTKGMGLANIYTALKAGITIFDASSGGLGGCPYAPGSSGNVATEDVVHMLHKLGIETNVDLPRLIKAAEWIEAKVDRTLPSHCLRAFQSHTT
ncbi:hydroxymethylglutaryl-CoA lyase [Bacillus altitudinis]|jgi:hydroxymethylglutaryl-CoA lyase|uniref:hydroxymethylglutaryl-CoA lyase n=1 Tax=Bacillus TaxID=1386 RepID=UPI001071FA73|nr:hydroxymethylglutaryl-CoA lyase [Bacillus altitudinis]MBR0580564.1 hydroxymethylglutaryl-CoA lyase [Bacillus altitudinis A23-8]MCM3044172.1 hydroxymethylglutaryl-CoA lyase [Bacillus altitudinis]MDF9414473.1 hydroxymethylglutaryl-CoA lyase [Bacillus altitudinis]MEC1803737.1 hydroxymethylglutaryl-CoA lyase [Bacillus altitudinis]MEC2040281.1 hydroxymethylglutaryl-CoA lyase [Bacillus altitudinis]